ncbi:MULTISPECIES: ABC transporter permease [Rhodopseudomonas]|uniref:Binding-protein-dependent transport systems inner membrane component n=1 Tax=Rhodopseudomonas palustris (strain DX-1) TaxID=652103 RepID=E6VNM0_RHOPX|nr:MULTISPECIES: ABC transporter permease [Rhodopseudomonas]NEW87757.1 ABC transporter permease [Rhodopseudomonas sp. WA056]
MTVRTSSAFVEFAARFARNRGALLGMIVIVLVVGLALAAPWLIDKNPLRIVSRPEVWPFTNPRYPLGTDSIGRNIFAMIVYGARTTLMIGIVAALTATVIGVVIGATAAWFGGWIDEILTRLTELFQTVPNILLIMTVVAILGQSIDNIIVAIGITMWPGIARLTRAEFLTLKNREFVLACRSMGMSNLRIMAGEILPNAIPPVIVLASVIIGSSILFESAISFLGLGDPNVASWGALIGDGRTLIRRSWYICAIPGLAIMLTVLAMNLIGDGLNDALNPKLRDR